MTILEIQIPVGIDERFTEEAAQSMIGQPFLAKNESYPIGVGMVLDAHVVDDGRALQAKIEWPE